MSAPVEWRCDRCGGNRVEIEQWTRFDPIAQRDEVTDCAGSDWYCRDCLGGEGGHHRDVAEHKLTGDALAAALAYREAEKVREAAPALLAALEALAQVAVWDEDSDRAEFDAASAQARAAIAAARGQA